MHHVIGGCEVTLPKLSQLVSSDKSKNIDEWYAGKVDEARPHACSPVLGANGPSGRQATRRSSAAAARSAIVKRRSRGMRRRGSCDACGKWRRLPQSVVLDEHEQNGRWTCKQNIWDREELLRRGGGSVVRGCEKCLIRRQSVSNRAAFLLRSLLAPRTHDSCNTCHERRRGLQKS